MKGRVLEQISVNDIMDQIVIEETDTKKIVTCTVDKLRRDYSGKIISLHTAVTEINNSNFGFVYPEGTICTLLKKN